MRALAWALAAVTLVGVVCRLLPGPLSALPFVPVVVAATPWYALTALASLAPFVWNLVAAGRVDLSVAGTLPPALMVLVVLLEAFWQGPFFALSPTNAVQSATNQPATFELRVMTCNVYKGRADAARIVELVRTEGVQVLALQETTADFVNELEAAGIDELLPHSQRSSSDGVYGNGLWSSLPLGDVASDDIGSSASAMPGGTVTPEGDAGDEAAARVRLVSVHTCAPGPGHWNLWRKSIEEIGVARERLATDPDTRYVLLGDFNATYDHAPFREMLGVGADGPRLEDAARTAGGGLVSTWPSGRWMAPPLFGIDHVVVSDGVAARSVWTAHVDGTDHRALLCTLEIAGNGGA